MKIFNVTKQNKSKEEFQYESDEETGQILLDIFENSQEILLIAPIGGIDIELLDITYSEGNLKISGLRDRPDVFFGDYEIVNEECFWGKFERNILLPENLDFDNISASNKNSVLYIKIPKLKFKEQSIKIQS